MFSGADVKLLSVNQVVNILKGKIVLVRAMTSCSEVRVFIHLFLTSALNRAFYPRGKRARKLLNERKSRPDVLAKRKICCSCWHSNRFFSEAEPVAWSRHRVRCPCSWLI